MLQDDDRRRPNGMELPPCMDGDSNGGGCGGGGQSWSMGSSSASWAADCCNDDVVVRNICARLPLLCSINGFEVKGPVDDKSSCS